MVLIVRGLPQVDALVFYDVLNAEISELNSLTLKRVTHCGLVTACAVSVVNIGSGNGLLPDCQAIMWTNDELLSVESPGTKHHEK